MSNASRLADLIETKVPKKYRPTFTRFVETSDDNELIGAVADLVEGGAITSALRMISDSKLAALALLVAVKIKRAFIDYVRVLRSDEFMNTITVLIARNSVSEAIDLIDAPLMRVAEAIQSGYATVGKDITADFTAALEGMRPSTAPVIFTNVAEPARVAEASATNSAHAVRNAVDAITATEEQVKLSKDATKTAVWDAQEARLSAQRAMKSIQAALDSAAKLRSIPGDVTGAITDTSRKAIQAAEDAAKLADRAQAMLTSSPEQAAAQADKAAQAAREAARAAQEAKQDAQAIEALARGLRPSVGINFDPTNPRAAQAANELTYEFIQGKVSQEQRDAVRDAVTRALAEGKNPKQVSAAFRDAIGLTPKQNEAVENYRRLLQSGSKEALDRSLRDRRFDPTVRRADEKPLSQDQIDKMVDRYRERYIEYRADTIALTESTTATSAANHEAMLQTIELADIDPGDVEKKWNSTKDGRTRPSHVYLGAAANNTVRGIDTLFTSGLGNKLMFPGDIRAPAEDRVRCRCVCSYRIVF